MNPTGLAAASWSSDRPVLLLADQPWDARGGGAVILRSLIEGRLGNGVVWVTPSRVEGGGEGRYGLSAGSVGRTGHFSMLADTLRYSGRLADQVGSLAAKVDAAALWVVLHGASVAVAARLARTARLRMHVSVHDDPVQAVALRSRRLALFAPLIARDFRTTLRAAWSVDVVSAAMGDRYLRKYGVSSDVVHRGLADPVAPGPPYDPGQSGMTIGVLGNTYAHGPLRTLARAAELAARRLGSRARIVVCGGGTGERLRREFTGRVDVEVAGHLPEGEGIERLRRCGVLYLNYPFGWLDRVLRETSFPTKLSTYVYAARPLLAHAPPGTTLADLPEGGGYVTRWENAAAEDGAALLARVFADPRIAYSYHTEAEEVRRMYFDFNNNYKTINDILRSLATGVRAPGGRSCD